MPSVDVHVNYLAKSSIYFPVSKGGIYGPPTALFKSATVQKGPRNPSPLVSTLEAEKENLITKTATPVPTDNNIKKRDPTKNVWGKKR